MANSLQSLEERMRAAEHRLAEATRELGGKHAHVRLLEATATAVSGRVVRNDSPPLGISGRGAYSRAIEEQRRLARVLPKASQAFNIQGELQKIDGTSGVLIDMAVASLKRGWPGYVSPSVCDLVSMSAESVPDITLRPEMLLAPSCFLLLGQPMTIESVSVERGIEQEVVRAISWYTYGPVDDVTHQDQAGVFLIFWIDFRAAEPALAMLDLFPMCVASWVFGETRTQSMRVATALEDRWSLEIGTRWLAAFTSFCDQHLIQAEPLPAERAIRRRLEREGQPLSDILVIELRRTRHQNDKPSQRREWSCSWVVRGHWRQQACGVGWKDRRAIWIAPYPKGDESKEFRINPERVFAVVR